MVHSTVILWCTLLGFVPYIPCAEACDGSARYTLTFQANWTSSSHPQDFPSRHRPHFSPVVGCSHNPTYNVWQPGRNATNGFKIVAEYGVTGLLISEILIHIRSKAALVRFVGKRVPNTGSTTVRNIVVNTDHHLVSAITMIAPSPDWIIGVHGLNLCDTTTGKWVNKLVSDLYPYDAGTDSATTFVHENTETTRQEPIHRITHDTEGSFRSDQPIKPLGTFTFEKVFQLLPNSGEKKSTPKPTLVETTAAPTTSSSSTLKITQTGQATQGNVEEKSSEQTPSPTQQNNGGQDISSGTMVPSEAGASGVQDGAPGVTTGSSVIGVVTEQTPVSTKTMQRTTVSSNERNSEGTTVSSRTDVGIEGTTVSSRLDEGSNGTTVSSVTDVDSKVDQGSEGTTMTSKTDEGTEATSTASGVHTGTSMKPEMEIESATESSEIDMESESTPVSSSTEEGPDGTMVSGMSEMGTEGTMVYTSVPMEPKMGTKPSTVMTSKMKSEGMITPTKKVAINTNMAFINLNSTIMAYRSTNTPNELNTTRNIACSLFSAIHVLIMLLLTLIVV